MYTTQQIRELYPNPRPCPSVGEEMDGYCIGGAVVQFALANEGLNVDTEELWFPVFTWIADALQALNPLLPDEVAQENAEAITCRNDAEEFDEGWQIVDAMLSYHP